MIYCLDTPAFLWLLRAPERLPDEVLRLCDDPEVDLAISAASAWQMSLLSGSGRLNAADLLDDFEAIIEQAGIRLLETTVQQMIRSGQLPRHHRDPIDRLLAAQALEWNATLLSQNPIFDRYGVRRIWN